MRQHAAKLFAIMLLFSSCKQENDNQIKSLIKGLSHSNALIQHFSDRASMDLEDKAKQSFSSTRVQMMVAKGKKVTELTSGLVSHIDVLIQQLQEKESEIKQVKNGSVTEAGARELFNLLLVYKTSLLDLFNSHDLQESPMMQANWKREKTNFYRQFPVLDFLQDSIALITASAAEQKWLDSSFDNATQSMQHALLLKIKNDVLLSAQQSLDFFFKQTAEPGWGHHDFFAPIAVLNSSYVKSEEVIEVRAGFGTFSNAANPAITIDGKKFENSWNGLATYKFTAKHEPGKYAIPVTFEYIKPDGTKATYNTKLEYTVAK